MKTFPILVLYLCVLVSLASAGWHIGLGKKIPKKTFPRELRTAKLYVFDRNSYDDVSAEVFVKLVAQLRDAYTSGELEDTNENKRLVSSWFELNQLTGCDEENYVKLQLALEESHARQNVVNFIKWKRNILKIECAEENRKAIREKYLSDKTGESDDLGEATFSSTLSEESKKEVEQKVDRYQKYVFDKGALGNILPETSLEMVLYLRDAYETHGIAPDTPNHQQSVEYLYELTRLKNCDEDSMSKFDRAIARDGDCQNVVSFVLRQRDLLKKGCEDYRNYGMENRGSPLSITPSSSPSSINQNEEVVQQLVDRYQNAVFDKGGKEKIPPETFLQMLEYLKDVYEKGTPSDSFDHWKSVYYLYELTRLTECDEDTFGKFDRAVTRDSECQNVVTFVDHQRNLLTQKCSGLQGSFSHLRRDNHPKINHSSSKREIQRLVNNYQKLIFSNQQNGENLAPEKLRKMVFNLHDAYKEGASPLSYDHWQTVEYLYELTQLTRCSEENYDKFDRALERNKGHQNVIAFIIWQRSELKRICVQMNTM